MKLVTFDQSSCKKNPHKPVEITRKPLRKKDDEEGLAYHTFKHTVKPLQLQPCGLGAGREKWTRNRVESPRWTQVHVETASDEGAISDPWVGDGLFNK